MTYIKISTYAGEQVCIKDVHLRAWHEQFFVCVTEWCISCVNIWHVSACSKLLLSHITDLSPSFSLSHTSHYKSLVEQRIVKAPPTLTTQMRFTRGWDSPWQKRWASKRTCAENTTMQAGLPKHSPMCCSNGQLCGGKLVPVWSQSWLLRPRITSVWMTNLKESLSVFTSWVLENCLWTAIMGLLRFCL